jgi:hypothetical protein
MSALLEKAIEETNKLPESEQDAFGEGYSVNWFQSANGRDPLGIPRSCWLNWPTKRWPNIVLARPVYSARILMLSLEPAVLDNLHIIS